jgi:hypothetical protein
MRCSRAREAVEARASLPAQPPVRHVGRRFGRPCSAWALTRAGGRSQLSSSIRSGRPPGSAQARTNGPRSMTQEPRAELPELQVTMSAAIVSLHAAFYGRDRATARSCQRQHGLRRACDRRYRREERAGCKWGAGAMDRDPRCGGAQTCSSMRMARWSISPASSPSSLIASSIPVASASSLL